MTTFLLASFTVLHRDFSLPCPATGRDLAFKVSYPADSSLHPVIIFSHGFSGSKEGYRPLVDSWVKEGYVCIQPNHADALDPKAIRAGRQKAKKQEGFGNWAERPKEIRFLIDSLGKISTKLPEAHMDLKRLGMAGHSFGAGTSELIAGTRPRTGQDLSDTRPLAILMLSPQGRGTLYNLNSWKNCTRPMMVVTGSNDLDMRGFAAELRKDPYLFSPPGDKYLMWIDGAYHNFGGISGIVPYPGSGPRNDEMVGWVQKATLAFWDLYLRGNSKAKQTLNPQNLSDLSDGAVQLSER